MDTMKTRGALLLMVMMGAAHVTRGATETPQRRQGPGEQLGGAAARGDHQDLARAEEDRGEEGAVDEEQLLESIDEITRGFKDFIHHANVTELEARAARTISLNIPQSSFFSQLLGFDASSSVGSLVFLAFVGWPVMLGLLYLGLILAYPNKRSDNPFERTMLLMVDKFGKTMQVAEDNMFDLLEEMTDPGHHGHRGPGHIKRLIPAHGFLAEAQDRQEVFFKPGAYYDDYGDLVDLREDYEEVPGFDAWGNPVPESTFVAPDAPFLNPVSSFNPAGHPFTPLTKHLKEDDAEKLQDQGQLSNVILEKDRHNFLSVVLGAQYQHSRPPAQPAQDPGIITGSIHPDSRPQPPPNYRPQPSTFDFRFDAPVDPRVTNTTSAPGFQVPEFTDGGDGWVAVPKPFRKRKGGATNESNVRFPEDAAGGKASGEGGEASD